MQQRERAIIPGTALYCSSADAAMFDAMVDPMIDATVDTMADVIRVQYCAAVLLMGQWLMQWLIAIDCNVDVMADTMLSLIHI